MFFTLPGRTIAEQAKSGDYVGIPYSQLDCQGFVEEVLKDAGIRKPNGGVYNWRGSNSMWRNYIVWRGTIDECIDKYGKIPLGAFLFRIVYDGGEKEKGYDDNLGNASHVGLYVGSEDDYPAMDSQRDKGRYRLNAGVSYCQMEVFNHVGLMCMIDYSQDKPIKPDKIAALAALDVLREFIKGC